MYSYEQFEGQLKGQMRKSFDQSQFTLRIIKQLLNLRLFQSIGISRVFQWHYQGKIPMKIRIAVQSQLAYTKAMINSNKFIYKYPINNSQEYRPKIQIFYGEKAQISIESRLLRYQSIKNECFFIFHAILGIEISQFYFKIFLGKQISQITQNSKFQYSKRIRKLTAVQHPLVGKFAWVLNKQNLLQAWVFKKLLYRMNYKFFMETQQLPLNLFSKPQKAVTSSEILSRIFTTLLICATFMVAYFLMKCSSLLDYYCPAAKTSQLSYKIYYKSDARRQKSQFEKRIVLRDKFLESLDRDARLKEKEIQEKVDLVRKKINQTKKYVFFHQTSLKIEESSFYRQNIRSYPTIPDEEMKAMRKKASAYEHKTQRSLKYIL